MSEKGLDITNVDPLLEEVCGKRVPQRMQADPLGDARGCCPLVEDAAPLAGGEVLPLPTSRKEPPLSHRHIHVKTCRAHLPPLSQRREQLRRQHDVPVLASFRLNDADDHLRAVDVASSEPDDLAGAKPPAIAG